MGSHLVAIEHHELLTRLQLDHGDRAIGPLERKQTAVAAENLRLHAVGLDRQPAAELPGWHIPDEQLAVGDARHVALHEALRVGLRQPQGDQHSSVRAPCEGLLRPLLWQRPYRLSRCRVDQDRSAVVHLRVGRHRLAAVAADERRHPGQRPLSIELAARFDLVDACVTHISDDQPLAVGREARVAACHQILEAGKAAHFATARDIPQLRGVVGAQ